MVIYDAQLSSCFTETSFATAGPLPALVSPQAVTAELAAKFFRFIAAFTSRSWCVPQSGQVHSRTDNGSSSWMTPHTRSVVTLAGGGFEPPTSGLWARRATRLLYPAVKAPAGVSCRLGQMRIVKMRCEGPCRPVRAVRLIHQMLLTSACSTVKLPARESTTKRGAEIESA